MIVSFSPRDTILESEGSIGSFDPRRGTSLGVLRECGTAKGRAGWVLALGCCGFGHVRPGPYSPVIFIPPGGSNGGFSACLLQGNPDNLAALQSQRSLRFSFFSSQQSANHWTDPFLIMRSSQTLSWITRFTSNKTLDRGSLK